MFYLVKAYYIHKISNKITSKTVLENVMELLCDKINKKFENSNDSFKFSLICTLNYGIIFIML